MTDREPSKASESLQQSLANRETVAPSGLEDSTPTGSGPFTALPSQFGRYRVTKLLGYGAMGTVYLAFDPELDKEVALKIPKADLAKDPALWERFQREARATGDLDFPSICGMYEIGQIDGTHYISMQYIDGRPLSEFVSDNQSQRKVASVVRKLALGLAHAHERGIVHRDLKPANVMIDTQGDPVIMDFGLARRLEMGGDVRATQSGMIVGSPAYMSPEQAKAEHDQIGPRTDIYGLGVLFFELLTGALPFRGPMVVVLGQIATQPPPKPSSLRADVDPRLESLCLKMLDKQPQNRPSSMTEVAQALTDWLKGGGSSPEIALREAASPTESVALTPAKPALPTRTAKADGIEAQKQRVTDLLDKCQYGSAIELLEKIAHLRDERFASLVAWARPQLKAARATEQNVREASAPSCDTARQLLKHYDYVGVIQVLEQVPPAYRSVELRDLLENVTNLRDECDHLQRDIEEAVRTGDTESLPASVKRLYKLKPNNKAIKQLAEELKKDSAKKVIARRQGQSRFLDTPIPIVEPKHIALSIILVVGLFVGISVLVRSYLVNSQPSPPMRISEPVGKAESGAELRTAMDAGSTRLQGNAKIQLQRPASTATTLSMQPSAPPQPKSSRLGREPALLPILELIADSGVATLGIEPSRPIPSTSQYDVMMKSPQQISARGIRYVTIRGIIPKELQSQAFADALDGNDSTKLLVYTGFVLERQAAVSGAEPWRGPWEIVNHRSSTEVLHEVAGFDEELAPPSVIDPILTMELPYRIIGNWGNGASHPLVAISESPVLLFRYLDFDVTPGMAYRYRAKLKLLNPNFERPRTAIIDPTVSEGRERESDWSNISNPAVVPTSASYFLKDIDRDPSRDDKVRSSRPIAFISMFQWDARRGTMLHDTLKIHAVGQFISETKKTTVVDVGTPSYRDDVEVSFETNDLLLDASGDFDIRPEMHPDLGLRSDRGHASTSLGLLPEVLVMTSEGELKVLDPVFEKSKEDRLKSLVDAEREPYNFLKERDYVTKDKRDLIDKAAASLVRPIPRKKPMPRVQ